MSSYEAMFAPRAEDDERAMSEINTTPLVDVMLVLLIVFMITIPVITQTVPVELPKGAQPGDADQAGEHQYLRQQGRPDVLESVVDAGHHRAARAPEGGRGAEAAARSARARRPDDALRVRRPGDSDGAAGRHPEGRVHHGARSHGQSVANSD